MDDKKKCYTCGKGGHIQRNCRYNSDLFRVGRDEHVKSNLILIKNKVTRCFVCKKLGHKSKECPNGKYFDLNEHPRKNEETPGTSNFSIGDEAAVISQAFDSIDENEWDFIKTENSKESSVIKRQNSEQTVGGLMRRGQEQSKYYKVVMLGNIKFNGYLDTCSEKCLIKYSAAKRAQLNVQLDDTDVMANSPTFQGKIVSIGKAKTTMSVDSVEISNMELYVVNDNVLNIDVVVGRTWLDNPHILFLKIENAVHVGDITLHPFDKFASILSSFEVKLTSKKNEIDPRFDAVSSGDEDFGKPIKSEKKQDYDFVDDYSPPRKKSTHDMDYIRDRGREIVRERSRSRDRLRPSLRDTRPVKLIERSRRSRSRDRSWDRYMSRHGGRH